MQALSRFIRSQSQQTKDAAIPILNSTFSNRKSTKTEPTNKKRGTEKNLGGALPPMPPLGAGSFERGRHRAESFRFVDSILRYFFIK